MREVKEYTILSAAGANGSGKAIDCRDFRHAILSFATDGGGNAALTVKFQGAISPVSNAAPAFGSAQAVANLWDYIEVLDLQSGTAIDGDTGVAVATADDYRLFQMNIDGLMYVNAIVSGRTAGTVTIKVLLFND